MQREQGRLQPEVAVGRQGEPALVEPASVGREPASVGQEQVPAGPIVASVARAHQGQAVQTAYHPVASLRVEHFPETRASAEDIRLKDNWAAGNFEGKPAVVDSLVADMSAVGIQEGAQTQVGVDQTRAVVPCSLAAGTQVERRSQKKQVEGQPGEGPPAEAFLGPLWQALPNLDGMDQKRTFRLPTRLFCIFCFT